MTVGERIRLAREAKNLSQTELANACKISKQTLYKYENNIITNIPSDKIEVIANYLLISPAYLMGWENIDSKTDDNPKLNDVYFSLAKSAQEEGIDPDDIKLAIETIKAMRNKKDGD